MCLIGGSWGGGGGGGLCDITLQPMAADGEKTQEEDKEEWVTKQPVVTLMEWKQKPGVWQKTSGRSKSTNYSERRRARTDSSQILTNTEKPKQIRLH